MWVSFPAFCTAILFLFFGPACSASEQQGSNDHMSGSYTRIVAFGDSFTDNGDGARKLSNGTWPPPYYYEGRFSNGPVWIELIAGNLSVPLNDYAIGGATTSNAIVAGFTGNGSTIPVPSIDDQVSSFLASPPAGTDMTTTLFAVTGGANDIFFNYNVSALTSASVLAQSISRLQNAGAKHFLLFNYYDIALTPFASYADVPTKAIVEAFSVELGVALAALALQTARATPDVTFLDLRTQLMPHFYYYGEPTAYGYDRYGAYGSCLTGVYMEDGKGRGVKNCGGEVDRRVFWDEYHLTARSHQWFARALLDKMKL